MKLVEADETPEFAKHAILTRKANNTLFWIMTEGTVESARMNIKNEFWKAHPGRKEFSWKFEN